MPLDFDHLLPEALGGATVEALRLNNEFIVVARQFWVEAGRWPSADDQSDERPAVDT
jgi:hypothetical protein